MLFLGRCPSWFLRQIRLWDGVHEVGQAGCPMCASDLLVFAFSSVGFTSMELHHTTAGFY